MSPTSPTNKSHQIAVIGAGIVGLSSALCLQQAIPSAHVTIIADRFEEDLVSFGAVGFYRPNLNSLVRGDNEQLIRQCLRYSWDHFSGLAMSEHSKDSGQFLVSGLLSHRKSMDYGYSMMRECCFGFHRVPDSELVRRGVPKEFKYTYACTSVMTQTHTYMPWMTNMFKQNGGTIQKRTVNNLEELFGEFQLVVNCCGHRALTFLEDKECFPIRGQLVNVKAPWIKLYHYFDNEVFVYPHQDSVLVGVTRIPGDGSTEVDPEVTKTILRNAQDVHPELKGAEILSEWAGSRPGRSRPRLEVETLHLGGNRALKVIHNYGHGGNGITLSWGTGVHTAKLAKEALQTTAITPPKSSL